MDNADPKEGIPRVPNWATGIEVGGSGDHPDIQDLDADNLPLWGPFADGVAPPIVRATHSDMLHALFKTTRRITMLMKDLLQRGLTLEHFAGQTLTLIHNRLKIVLK